MLTLDTSAVVAAAVRKDPSHLRVVEVLKQERGPFLIPAGILGEIAYVLEHRAGQAAAASFLRSLAGGTTTLDCGESDFDRILELTERYDDLPLGFSDASVIACAERRGGRVVSVDRRDFDVVARGEGSITILP